MTITLDRDIRQRDLIPPNKLSETKVTICGVGAIGRQASLMLAAVGVPRISLIDFDHVSIENLAPQGFYESDMGRPKVDAVADICRSINPSVDVKTANQRFKSIQFTGGVIFCCVDSIVTRGQIFNVVKTRTDLWIDARMSAEYLRVLTVHDDASRKYYGTTLFPSAESYRGSCTAKATIYCANIAAGIMVAQFAKWLRGCDLDRDIDVNILTSEMGVK